MCVFPWKSWLRVEKGPATDLLKKKKRTGSYFGEVIKIKAEW
jgi:hypothetical protein